MKKLDYENTYVEPSSFLEISKLNPAPISAAKAVLSGLAALALQAGPGTGKTEWIARLALTFASAGLRVLLAAQSAAASKVIRVASRQQPPAPVALREREKKSL